MQLAYIFLSLCLPFAIAVPFSENTFDVYIRKVLVLFQEKMATGIPEMKMPPLDPLKIPLIDERIKDGMADVKIKLTNIEATGLSNFNVKRVNFDMASMTADIGLFLPSTTAKGKYDLDGKVLIFPLYGKGDALFQLTDFDIGVKTKVDLNGGKIHLQTFNIKMSFSNAQIYLENILGGGEIGTLVNTVLNMIGKLLFDSQRHVIERELNTVIRKAINTEIAKLDFGNMNMGFYNSNKHFYASQTTGNANNYVDELLKSMRPLLGKYDPLALPEVKDSFKEKVGFITFSGSARLYNGEVRGLSTLHRTGDTQLSVDEASGLLTISVNAGVTNTIVKYNAFCEFIGIKAYGQLNGIVSRVRVYAKAVMNLKTGNRDLTEFRILSIEKPNVSIHGLSILDPIINLVAKIAVNPILNSIRGTLESTIKNALSDAVRNAKISIF